MLPAPTRLRRRPDFTATVRRGRRGRSGLLLVHLLTSSDRISSDLTSIDPTTVDAGSSAPACGFIVSKAVGGSVVRHRVLRRLRHLMIERLDRLPPGSRLVVRAFPAAATASSTALGAALDRSLRSVLERPEGAVAPERSLRR